MTGSRTVKHGTKIFGMAQGTSQLYRHAETYNASANEKQSHKCTLDEKQVISEVAPNLATFDTLPLGFSYHNRGFLILANALIQLGQRYPCSTEIEVRDVFPVEKTFCDTFTIMGTALKSNLQHKVIEKLLAVHGVITSDRK